MHANIATFDRKEPAEALVAKLQAAGLKATINDERTRKQFFFISEPVAGVRVEIDPDHYEEALKQYNSLPADDPIVREAVHCPECRSPRVEYPQTTRRFLLPAFGALLMAIGLLPKSYYCQDCHYTWPRKPPMPSEQGATDELGWPKKSKVFHPETKPGSSKAAP